MFIRPLIRPPLAFCIHCSCVAVDGCSSPSGSAARLPKPGLSWYSHALHPLCFQAFEETLHKRVIPVVTTATHALLVAPQHLAELNAGVRAALIRGKHQL